MSETTKTIIENYGRIEAIANIEQSIDFLNNKMYLYTLEYMETDAYTDTYAHYATLQMAYYNLLRDLQTGV